MKYNIEIVVNYVRQICKDFKMLEKNMLFEKDNIPDI